MKPQQQVVHHRRKSCWFPTGLTLSALPFLKPVVCLCRVPGPVWGGPLGARQMAKPVHLLRRPQLSHPAACPIRKLPVQGHFHQFSGPESAQPPVATIQDQWSWWDTHSSEIISLRIDNDVLRLKLMLAHLLLYGWLNVVLTYFTWKIWMLIMCFCS